MGYFMKRINILAVLAEFLKLCFVLGLFASIGVILGWRG